MRIEKIQKVDRYFYGLNVFYINDKEYAVSTIAQAEAAARQMARECLVMIGTELLLKHSYLPPKAVPLIRHLQDCASDEETQLLALVMNDMNALVEEAVTLYGRSYFLGVCDDGIELSLSQFPQWVAWFILQELELTPDERDQVCLYRLY